MNSLKQYQTFNPYAKSNRIFLSLFSYRQQFLQIRLGEAKKNSSKKNEWKILKRSVCFELQLEHFYLWNIPTVTNSIRFVTICGECFQCACEHGLTYAEYTHFIYNTARKILHSFRICINFVGLVFIFIQINWSFLRKLFIFLLLNFLFFYVNAYRFIRFSYSFLARPKTNWNHGTKL